MADDTTPSLETDSGPTYGSDDAGVREAARALSQARTMDPSFATAEPPPPDDPPPLTPQEERDLALRANHRRAVFDALEDERRKEGKSPITAKSGAEALAAIRALEQQAAADRAAEHEAEQQQVQVAELMEAQPQEPDAVAVARQEAAQAKQAADAERNRFIATTTNLYKEAIAQAERAFPEIRTAEDVARLAQTNPARYAQLATTLGQLQTVRNGIENAQAQQQVEHSARFREYAIAEDKKFYDKIAPELKDGAKLREAGENTINALKAFGLSEAEIGRAWNAEAFMRDSRVQAAMYELGKQWAAKEAVRNRVGRVPLPPVQRPGVSTQGNRDYSEVTAADRRFDSKPDVRNAAAFLSAQRRAQGPRR